MAQGYKIEAIAGLPALVVRLTFPPRLDVEKMFAEIATEFRERLIHAKRRLYRINDFSTYNQVNIFAYLRRGLASETRGWPGTTSDPRLYPILVGQGASVRLIVEALRKDEYGGWDMPAFPTLDEAVSKIRGWENGTDLRPADRLRHALGADWSHP